MSSHVDPAKAGPLPRVAPDSMTSLLRRVADSLLRLPYSTWNFGDSVAFEGMLAASDVLGEDSWLRFAQGMLRGWATRARPYVRLDCTAPGLAMVDTYRLTNDTLILEAALGLADYLASRPRLHGVYATWEHSPLQHPCGPGALPAEEVELLVKPPAGVFVDCLHFDPPFFTALGSVTGDRQWTDLGVEQALGYIRLLQEPSGLFAHFVLDGSAQRYGPGWGRGQGWALLGLLNVLAHLNPGEEAHTKLVAAVRRLNAAMLSLQRADGHWYAVVDDPRSGDESSTAAFMAAGLVSAARLDIADGASAEAATRALDAACAATNDAATLSGVSAAVNACTQASHYAHVPRGFVVPWGQGPLALALAAHLRTNTHPAIARADNRVVADGSESERIGTP